jgi:CubicO group peptidase (beta-lactamase class C family)
MPSRFQSAGSALLAVVVSLLATPAGAADAAPSAARSRNLVESLLATLATGDQAAYERLAQANFAPSALAEYPADEHADTLARIYADTGGLDLERLVGEQPGWVQAETRDRITGGRYCLTVTRSRENGRDGITDVSVRGLYPAGPQLARPTAEELAGAIGGAADAFAARDLFSGVILLAKDEQVILEKAYGPASVAFDAPMTLQTRLNVASIGKLFTGVAIAQLVEAGKLSYDDTVGKLLPDYPDEEVRRRVTVRQLLSHTSGLGPKDYYQGPLWDTRSRLRSVPDYLRIVAGTPLGSEPGKYHYSNVGFVILGAIVERVSGASFYDYVRDHVFAPAGMSRSFYPEMDAEDPDVAVPLTNLFGKGESYVYRLGRPRSAVYELAARGGPQGGAYVTARDLFAFERALRAGRLVSAETLRRMTEPVSPAGAGASGLTGSAREGLGVEVIVRNGHTFYGHTGGDLGVASLLYWYPDTGYTTILLSNRDPRAARVLANVTRALITRQSLGGATPPDQGCVPPANP